MEEGRSGEIEKIKAYEPASTEVSNSENSHEKQKIWEDILKMANSKDTGARKRAAELIPQIFPQVRKNERSFFDLVKLAEGQDTQIREKAAELFMPAYECSEDKQRAWDELVRLISSEDRKVRKNAVLALSSGFLEVPDKVKAWEEFVRLSNHSDNFVKRVAARALGAAFFYVPDKTEAWKDLQTLSGNPYLYVRKYALSSLGRASLWRALKAENEATFIFGLKEAVRYFKESTEVTVDVDFPDFYYSFYETFLFILFSDTPDRAGVEIEQYISKMSSKIRALGENQGLFEILGQLAGLLKDAKNLTPENLPAQKEILKSSIELFDKYSVFLESREEALLAQQKTVKKEHSNPGKDILGKVQNRKSSLRKKL